ncbi:MAG: pyridoxal phosphate-dependent aminotransferase [Tissierellia bacterium]|nr:pyridoxal phosphate-dependent aminotransferase [Tissierellia bacterium]
MKNTKDYFSSKVQVFYQGEGTVSIFDIASELERKGRKIMHMEIGKPNFDTPDAIKEAAITAIKKGNVHYTPPAGMYELREAITNRTKEKYGLEYNPLNEALITAGASEALYLIFIAFLNSDEEVMIPSPSYYSYCRQVDCTGSKYIEVPVLKDGVMKYDINDFEAKITDKTKLLLLNSPNNPTGYVMSDEELQEMADFAIKHDLIVISDECYEDFLYEGEFKSIASLPGMKERTLIINSTSKTFSMTGWRVGYILGNATFIECLQNVHEQLNICPTSFAQEGSIVAYREEIKEVEMMFNEYKKRKDYIVEYLSKIDKVSFYEPQGAFYIFLNVEKLGIDGSEFCLEILNEKGVALNPGESFGAEWKNYVRISYCCSMEDVIDAMDLIKEYIESK